MVRVTVYSPTTPCVACNSTKMRLKAFKIPFDAVTADDKLVEQYKSEGHASFPIVVVDMGDGATWTWSNFRIENLKRLKELFWEQNAEPLAA